MASSKTAKNDDNVIFGANQAEVERLNIQHKIIFDAMPQQIQAPIDLSKSGLRILDQATGSGIWIRDMRAIYGAGMHTWVGTDIEESYFPKDPPKDTSYHHQSMTEAWPEDWARTFDLVHSRLALPGIGTNPLKGTIKNLVNLVKPGGYIQLVEIDWDEWDAGPAGQVFHDAIKGLFSVVTGGQGVDLPSKLIPMLKELGMEIPQYKRFAIPYGAKASDKMRELSVTGLKATASSTAKTLEVFPPIGVEREKLETMAEELEKESTERGFAMNVFALWARKPSP